MGDEGGCPHSCPCPHFHPRRSSGFTWRHPFAPRNNTSIHLPAVRRLLTAAAYPDLKLSENPKRGVERLGWEAGPHGVPCVPIPYHKSHGAVMRFRVKQHRGAPNHHPQLQIAQFGVALMPEPTDHYTITMLFLGTGQGSAARAVLCNLGWMKGGGPQGSAQHSPEHNQQFGQFRPCSACNLLRWV